MNPLDARHLALKLLAQHGLHDWRFAFDRARRRFGCCRYRSKVISLSRPLTLLNDETQVADTLLHEIAHALTPGDGHGAKWRAACVRIGARPRRCYGESEVAAPPRRPAAYRYGCQPCKWWVDRRRLVANRYVCGKCGGKLFYEHKATGQIYRVEPRARGSCLVPVLHAGATESGDPTAAQPAGSAHCASPITWPDHRHEPMAAGAILHPTDVSLIARRQVGPGEGVPTLL